MWHVGGTSSFANIDGMRHLDEPGINGKTIIKWICKKNDKKEWTGCM
jgi:hypothetical protein